MDSLTAFEFHEIFDRVSMDIELKGATSALAIENRLKVARQYGKTRAQAAKRVSSRKFYGFKAEQFDKLIEHDFAGRSIRFARTRPRGIIAQTLLYGRAEAEKRIKAQKRAEIRRAYIKGEREIAKKVAKRLGLRERVIRPRRRRWWR